MSIKTLVISENVTWYFAFEVERQMKFVKNTQYLRDFVPNLEKYKVVQIYPV